MYLISGKEPDINLVLVSGPVASTLSAKRRLNSKLIFRNWQWRWRMMLDQECESVPWWIGDAACPSGGCPAAWRWPWALGRCWRAGAGWRSPRSSSSTTWCAQTSIQCRNVPIEQFMALNIHQKILLYWIKIGEVRVAQCSLSPPLDREMYT